jgi:hypothetical protein
MDKSENVTAHHSLFGLNERIVYCEQALPRLSKRASGTPSNLTSVTTSAVKTAIIPAPVPVLMIVRGCRVIAIASFCAPVIAIPCESFASIIDDPGSLIRAAYSDGGTWRPLPAAACPPIDAITTIAPIGTNNPAVAHVGGGAWGASPGTTVPAQDVVAATFHPATFMAARPSKVASIGVISLRRQRHGEKTDQ